MKTCLTLIFILCSMLLWSQNDPWIAYPSASVSDYGVYHFRKSFSLEDLPTSLPVHVSADTRYILYVNGELACYGPAKGDLKTYKYDVLDIAPFLNEGENLLAALVFNGGKDKALALQSVQTAFLLRAADSAYSFLDSDEQWRVMKNPAYSPVSYYEMLFKERWFYGFYACGPGDRVNAAVYPWGWEKADFDDSSWKHAEVLSFDGDAPWKLVARNIAFMDDHREYPAGIRLSKGAEGTDGFIDGTSDIRIPAGSSASVLFDYGIFTMGYPELQLGGGKGSMVKIKYAEALYEEVNLKAHRDSVKGLTMFGVWDEFYPDGEERTFRPLWKRAFRYVMLEVETGEEALRIKDLSSEYSGYPYPEMARFECDKDSLNEIFDICQRTLRMCSGETYYDTPFYEQLSYGGDNRPIAALSTYTSVDDRLLREVMRLYPQSANRETRLFKSAYPSRFDFDMGSWSLAWIQSLRDYYFIRGDADYVRQFSSDIEGVLGFFRRHTDESLGILGDIACQNFMDWSITKGSIPRRDDDRIIRHSTMLTLYYAHTLDCVVELYRAIGLKEDAEEYAHEAARIKKAIWNHCYDAKKQLFTDWPDREVYSQHSNILAILCNMFEPEAAREHMLRVLEYPGFQERASSYFSFLKFKALKQTGMEDYFLKDLGFWYNYIDRGHTTCGETGFASHDRSDCHAWSAHPAYFLLSMVCGIEPAEPGFSSVRIAPHPGDLEWIRADMPHPKGRIAVEYQIKKSRLHAEIDLPPGTDGIFEFAGELYELVEGMNTLKIKL